MTALPESSPAAASAIPPAMSPARRTTTDPASPEQQQQQGPKFTLPKLRLEFRDITHPGAQIFFTSVHASDVITRATQNVFRLLYRSPGDPKTCAPPTRSVTFILRDMPGVAYTTVTELDNDHKEIHFALNHIVSTGKARAGAEIAGVITHELVHCLQWNGRATCPGGLVEGVADWVRLRCDLAPPHWKREADVKWDAGYQHTAFFLDYLEGRFGEGFVWRLNEKLRVGRYDEKRFWTELTSTTVDALHKAYVEHLGRDADGS
ncbi:PBSP domain protein [Moelleriella libera RCEF 2490]|uniref:PBSP domain protein n=1 Tax=Moelleriella libera RCEF 2490 TaxID=1081109 RepID=A0A162K2H9_9HYPO|nr:PBSP domain protein [Moelleriella libera RCEF 2490]